MPVPQGESRSRSTGGDWDTHASDLAAVVAPPVDAEVAAFRERLRVANRRRARGAVSWEAWVRSAATHGHEL